MRVPVVEAGFRAAVADDEDEPVPHRARGFQQLDAEDEGLEVGGLGADVQIVPFLFHAVDLPFDEAVGVVPGVSQPQIARIHTDCLNGVSHLIPASAS